MPPFPDGAPSEPLRRRRRSEASGFPSEQDEQETWSAFGPPAAASAADPSGDGGQTGGTAQAPRSRGHAGQTGHGGHAAEPESAGGGSGMPWWARREQEPEANPWLPPTPTTGNPSVGTPGSGVPTGASAPGWPQEAPSWSPETPSWPSAEPGDRAAGEQRAGRQWSGDQWAGEQQAGHPAGRPAPAEQHPWPSQPDAGWTGSSGAWAGQDDGGQAQQPAAWEAAGWPDRQQEPEPTWPAAEPSWPSSEPAWGSDQSWVAPPEPAWPSMPDVPTALVQPEPQADPQAGASSWTAPAEYSSTYGGTSWPPEARAPETPSAGSWPGQAGAWAQPAAEAPVGWPQDATPARGSLDPGPAETGPVEGTPLPVAAPSITLTPEPPLRVIRAADEPAAEVPPPFLIPLTSAETSAIDLSQAAGPEPEPASEPDAATTSLLGAAAANPAATSETLLTPPEGSAAAQTGRRGRREPAAAPAPPPRAGRNLPASIAVSLGLGATVALSLLFRKEIFIAVAGVAMVVALWELAGAFAAKRIVVPVIPLGVGAAGMLVSAFVAGEEGLIVSFTLTAFGVVLWRIIDGVEGAARDIAASVFAAAYVPFLASFAILMLAEEDGPMRVISFVLVVFASDTGGYIAGVLFGKHPMAPKVSPKKSWEGFAGSTIGCLAMGAFTVTQLLDGDLTAGLVLGAATVVTATMGDLGESLIKRDLGIKDMSNILPGHGGVMDRMDSLLASAPVACLLLAWLVPVAT